MGEQASWELSMPLELTQRARARRHEIEQTSSHLHAQVSRVLRDMKVEHENEKDIEGLVVDIAVRGSRVALEVDGPSHFLKESDGTRSRKVNGWTLFKHRLLRRLHYRVCNLPYFEWGALNSKQQKQYLRNLLDDED